MEKGQVVIVLTLVMLVILTIGLSITQRSISNLATTTHTEQTSRAFFAADAGIEQAILNGGSNGTLNINDLGNNSRAQVTFSNELPGLNQAIGLPHTNKAEFAQFWLANPDDLSVFYNQPQLDIYFGNGDDAASRGVTPGFSDKPAIEVNVVTRQADGSFSSNRLFFDTQTGRGENFLLPGSPNYNCASANTSLSIPAALVNAELIESPKFYCKTTVSYTGTPIMVRVRILYSNGNQAVAITPNPSGCGQSCSFPPQIKVYTSTGTAGDTQRTLRVLESKKTLPSIFDFTILSAGNLEKR